MIGNEQACASNKRDCMSSSVGFAGFAAALALSCLAGWASAAGTDKVVPVKLAPDAPGSIRFDSCSRPVYPDAELRQNHHGTVTLRFLIGADGKVKDSRVVTSSGYPALDEAARAGIAKCSFHPARVEGKPVDAWTHVQYVWQP